LAPPFADRAKLMLKMFKAIGVSAIQCSSVVNALLTVRPIRLYVLLICGSAGWLSVILGPDNNWDLRFYHLYAPWAYLHGRYLHDIGPAQYQGFFNPTADLLFYALTSSILNETPRIIAFIMGALHGFNAVLILAIAIHVLRPLRLWERSMLRAVAILMGASGAGWGTSSTRGSESPAVARYRRRTRDPCPCYAG
jgi:hypothetical protein